MFIELITKKGEKFRLNVNKILYYTPNKSGNGTIIFDTEGLDYEVTISYDEVTRKIDRLYMWWLEVFCAHING